MTPEKLLDLSVKFGVRAEDMPYVDTWEDRNIPAMVDNWLIHFEA